MALTIYSAPSEIKLPEFDIKNLQAYFEAEKQYIKDVQEYARTKGEPHPLAGKRVSVPYADGAAEYVVFKHRGKTSLIHLQIGDAWSNPQFERLVTVAELRRIAY